MFKIIHADAKKCVIIPSKDKKNYISYFTAEALSQRGV